MEIHVSIGENRRFELREALLVYGDRQRSFVTRHRVVLHQNGPPTLEASQPLTMAFVESLAHSLYGGSPAEVLPEHVLAKGDRMIAWWTPACRRQMFYQNSELKAARTQWPHLPPAPSGLARRRRRSQDSGAPRKQTAGRGDETGCRSVLEYLGRWACLPRLDASSRHCNSILDPRLGTGLL